MPYDSATAVRPAFHLPASTAYRHRAQRVFHTQVRIGAPLNITGLTDYAQEPYYSTAVGLLHYGKESHLNGEAEVEKRVTASVGSWIKRLNSWLRKEF